MKSLPVEGELGFTLLAEFVALPALFQHRRPIVVKTMDLVRAPSISAALLPARVPP